MTKLNVAFQGGGARLVTLIAAACALRELETKYELEFDRIAGTSAGSIAACMFASKKPIDKQIASLRENGGALLKAMATPGPASIWNFLRGQPIYREETIRQMVHDCILRVDNNYTQHTLGDLRHKVSIVTSDLHQRERRVENETGDTPAAAVIAASCALPFVFRTFKHQDGVVDGGICSNLPTDLIVDRQSPHVVPLAFRFRKGEPPACRASNHFSYAASFLFTAMDSSVEIAAEHVQAAGGYVCVIPDQFGTMEFERALREGLKPDEFDPVVNSIRGELEQTILAIMKKDAARELQALSKPMNESITDIHNSLVAQYPYVVEEQSTCVLANSLCQAGDPRSEQIDEVHKVLRIKPAGAAGVFAFRAGFPLGGAPLPGRDVCEITDRNGKPILGATQIPVEHEDPDFGKGLFNLVFLKEPVPPHLCPISVVYACSQRDAMGSLEKAGEGDWLRSRSTKHTQSSAENMIVLLPKTFRAVVADDLMAAAATRPYVQAKMIGFQRSKASWIKCRPMNQRELARALKPLGAHARIGWTPVAWRANNLPPDHFCGVYLS